MKLCIRICRVAMIHTEQLMGAIGLEADASTGLWPAPEVAAATMREKFSPMAPGLMVFWGERSMTPVGMAVMGFDIRDPDVPQSAEVIADPLDREATLRLDGALLSELERLGVWTEPKQLTWRCLYELKGN